MALNIQFKNNATGTLSAPITNVDTSIVLNTGHGANFPSLTGGQYFYGTLRDSSNNLEIIKVTARSTDTLTVVRAQEGTTGRAYTTLDSFEQRDTAAGLVAIYTEATSPATIHAGASKATPVDADEIALYDSAATTTQSRVTFGNLKSTLFTAPALGTPTSGVVTNLTGNAKGVTTALDAQYIYTNFGGL